MSQLGDDPGSRRARQITMLAFLLAPMLLAGLARKRVQTFRPASSAQIESTSTAESEHAYRQPCRAPSRISDPLCIGFRVALLTDDIGWL